MARSNRFAKSGLSKVQYQIAASLAFGIVALTPQRIAYAQIHIENRAVPIIYILSCSAAWFRWK
jgi:hypothetical protein